MDPCIFGAETELGIVMESPSQVRPAPAELAAAVIDETANRYKCASSPLPHRRIFLANGSCIYEDLGHVELATAECANPFDFAAHTIALRRMLVESAQSVGRVYGVPLYLLNNNTDYAFGGANTYGYHLNFLVKRISHQQAATQLAPLLAAMPLLAGTGKASFATGSGGFELSQRAQYIGDVTGTHTTSSRAMITAKGESLCKEGIRLHLISIDTPCSAVQLFLVPAIIALTLKVAEEGKDFAASVALADPIRALHTVSTDPSLQAQLPTKDGTSITALGIHQYYLNLVADYLAGTNAPDWAEKVLSLWQQIIKNLQFDPFLEVKRLDWVKKLVVFTQQLEKAGLTWREYSRWTYVLSSVRRLKATWPELDPLRITRTASARAMLRRSALGVLEQYMANNQLSWKNFAPVWNTSNVLCQLCMRHHMLTPDRNDAFGASSSSTLFVDEHAIERSRYKPPSDTRAQVRGQAIEDSSTGATAWWTFVEQAGRRLVMDDALGEKASWQNVKSKANKETH